MISQSESAKKQGKTTGKKKDAVKSQGNEQTLASTKAVSKLAETQGQPGKKISLQWKNQIPRAQITGKSVRDFLLCFLAGGKQADWAVAHNITKAIFVIVEPFGMKSFKAARKEMPFLSAVEMHSVPIKAPGSKFEVFSLLTEILTCPFDKKLAGSSKSDFKAQRVINPSDVVLNEQQLADNYYPGYVDEKDVPCKPPKGSVQQPASEHKDSQHTAVDSKVADSKSDRSKTSVEPILPEKKSKRMKLEDGKESKGEEEVRDSEGGKKGAKTKHVNGDGGKQGRSEAQEQQDQSERQSKSKSKKKKDKSAHDDGSASVCEDADVVGSAGTTQVEVTSGAVEAKPLAIELPEYVRTKSTGGGSTSERMVAMDCEMCTTCLGLELARVSLVGEEGEVLLDEFVVPENPILDYNTLYSGITKELLQGVTNTIRDIQRRLVEIIDADTILVLNLQRAWTRWSVLDAVNNQRGVSQEALGPSRLH